MKTKVIVNPNSANGRTRRQWKRFEPILRKKLEVFDVTLTSIPGEAIGLTNRALLEGFERIIAVGGDGTVSEVVNGFFNEKGIVHPEAQLSLLMMGTGGDFSKSLGMSNDFHDSLEIVLRGRVKPIDIGRLSFVGHDGREKVRYFANIASFGMGGEVDIRVNKAKYSKLLGGKAAYFWASLQTLIIFKNKPVRIRVDDHFDETLSIKNVAIANGQYFGGGMWIAPHALIHDGLLDIIILGDIGRIALLIRTREFYKGSHLKLPGVIHLKGRRIEAESTSEVLMDVDGEPLGRLPATFEILPGAINLIC